jgi:hypothetical protein
MIKVVLESSALQVIVERLSTKSSILLNHPIISFVIASPAAFTIHLASAWHAMN